MLIWTHEHETYLRELKNTCEELSRIHQTAFKELKRKQRYYRIPCIVIGSISGTMSFGTSTFPQDFQRYVSILVGGVSLSIAILQSIESYLKIGERMSGHLTASHDYQKLAEDIHIELSLTPPDRSSQGVSFTRTCYERYEKMNGVSPYLKKAILAIATSKRNSTDCSHILSDHHKMVIHIPPDC